MNNCCSRILECEWDKEKNPDSVPLPPTKLKRVHDPAGVMTSGFFMKYKKRISHKAAKEAGDITIQDLTAEIIARDGQPKIIGLNPAVHLKPGRGKGSSRFPDGVIREDPTKANVTIEYFEGVFGRADMLRFLFAKAGVEYKYIGYDFPTWGQIKANG